MNHLYRVGMLVLVIALWACTTAIGQEQSLRSTIESQWDRYKERLHKYQYRQVKSHYDLMTGKERINHMVLEHKHRGPCKLFLLESKERSSNVVAINGHYAFSLEKDEEGLPWRVSEIDLDMANGIQLRGTGRRELAEDFSDRYSPYVLGDAGTLLLLLKRPGFSVTKTIEVGDKGLTKVWFKASEDQVSEKQTTSMPIEGAGWLLLDSTNYWSIMEFELPFYSPRFPKAQARGKYQYQMAGGSFPLLKQIEVSFYPPEETGKPMTRSVIDYFFEKRIPGEKEFRLSGFGFPEPMGTRPLKRATPWYIWISLAGFGALSAGIMMALFRRRFIGSGSAETS